MSRTIRVMSVHERKRQLIDVLIVDSAGGLHIDDEMMQEIQAVHGVLSPVETVFVIDSMMGQDDYSTIQRALNVMPCEYATPGYMKVGP